MTSLTVVAGGKATGKTRTEQVNFTNPCLVRQKVLIFDSNNEYNGIRKIKPSNIAKFSKQKSLGICRIVPDTNILPIKTDAIILKALKQFKEGVLVIDYWLGRSGVREVVDYIEKIMIEKKHGENKLDIIIHYQSLSSLPRRLFDYVDVFRLHGEVRETHHHPYLKDSGYYDLFAIANNIVKRRVSGDKYFSIYIDMHSKRIVGDYSKNEYREACIDLLLEKNNLLDYQSY